MVFKSKHILSNQCYNDIVKLIIDLIPVKHNMPKDLYQYKKIASGLGMNYERIDACKKIECCFRRSTRTTPDSTPWLNFSNLTKYHRSVAKNG
jgi:hypothetical protein